MVDLAAGTELVPQREGVYALLGVAFLFPAGLQVVIFAASLLIMLLALLESVLVAIIQRERSTNGIGPVLSTYPPQVPSLTSMPGMVALAS